MADAAPAAAAAAAHDDREFTIETWAAIFNQITTDETPEYTTEMLTFMQANSGKKGRTCRVGAFPLRKNDPGFVQKLCGERVITSHSGNTKLQQPFRANMCHKCRLAHDGQWRYAPAASATVTFTHQTDKRYTDLIFDCTNRTDLLHTLKSCQGGYAAVAEKISSNNARLHTLAKGPAGALVHRTHVFALKGKVNALKLLRVFDTDVQYVTIIDIVGLGVTHYEIQRSPNDGVPKARPAQPTPHHPHQFKAAIPDPPPRLGPTHLRVRIYGRTLWPTATVLLDQTDPHVHAMSFMDDVMPQVFHNHPQRWDTYRDRGLPIYFLQPGKTFGNGTKRDTLDPSHTMAQVAKHANHNHAVTTGPTEDMVHILLDM